MLETRWSGLARSTTKINRGMNESADVSPLLIFRSKPYSKIPLSKQSVHNVSGCCALLTEYDFAAIQNANNLITRCSVPIDFQKFCMIMSDPVS